MGDMKEDMGEMKEDIEIPQPFLGAVNIEDAEEIYEEDGISEVGAAVANPNKNDTRKLFQERTVAFDWNVRLPYEDQPNRLESEGPTPLLFPDHFYQTEGGIVIIY